jgi:hypothetical protein
MPVVGFAQRGDIEVKNTIASHVSGVSISGKKGFFGSVRMPIAVHGCPIEIQAIDKFRRAVIKPCVVRISGIRDGVMAEDQGKRGAGIQGQLVVDETEFVLV